MRANMEVRKEDSPRGAEAREKLRAAIELKNYEFNAGVELGQRYRSNGVMSDGTPEPAYDRDPELYYHDLARGASAARLAGAPGREAVEPRRRCQGREGLHADCARAAGRRRNGRTASAGRSTTRTARPSARRRSALRPDGAPGFCGARSSEGASRAPRGHSASFLRVGDARVPREGGGVSTLEAVPRRLRGTRVEPGAFVTAVVERLVAARAAAAQQCPAGLGQGRPSEWYIRRCPAAARRLAWRRPRWFRRPHRRPAPAGCSAAPRRVPPWVRVVAEGLVAAHPAAPARQPVSWAIGSPPASRTSRSPIIITARP
jgi:hypothetical protein